MLDSYGFDLWADTYDATVQMTEEDDQYPFAGYSRLMNAIYGTVMIKAPRKVLDVGFGTAMLTKKLYDAGCGITGIDFSAAMVVAAQRKMPEAKLMQWDFAQGIPPAWEKQTFDCVISTYALQNLAGEGQTAFLRALLKLLKPKGTMLIGDVCFQTENELRNGREKSGDLWDEEENYIVFSKLQESLKGYHASFHAFSFCCGVIEIGKHL